jgi:hypothetical protein
MRTTPAPFTTGTQQAIDVPAGWDGHVVASPLPIGRGAIIRP